MEIADDTENDDFPPEKRLESPNTCLIKVEITRALADAGRLVLVDWAAMGSGDYGPPLDERFSGAETAIDLREAGFYIEHTAVRPETFLLIGELR